MIHMSNASMGQGPLEPAQRITHRKQTVSSLKETNGMFRWYNHICRARDSEIYTYLCVGKKGRLWRTV